MQVHHYIEHQNETCKSIILLTHYLWIKLPERMDGYGLTRRLLTREQISLLDMRSNELRAWSDQILPPSERFRTPPKSSARNKRQQLIEHVSTKVLADDLGVRLKRLERLPRIDLRPEDHETFLESWHMAFLTPEQLSLSVCRRSRYLDLECFGTPYGGLETDSALLSSKPVPKERVQREAVHSEILTPPFERNEHTEAMQQLVYPPGSTPQPSVPKVFGEEAVVRELFKPVESTDESLCSSSSQCFVDPPHPKSGFENSSMHQCSPDGLGSLSYPCEDGVDPPSYPCQAVKRWFLVTLVPTGTCSSQFLGRTSDILKSKFAIDTLFIERWNAWGPKYYAFLDCWLPNLDFFVRQDGTKSANAVEVLFSACEKREIMLSFGVKDRRGLSAPRPLALSGIHFEDCCRFFQKFKLRSRDIEDLCGSWWPCRYAHDIVNLIEVMDEQKRVHQQYELEIRASCRDPSHFSYQLVVNDTYKVLDGSQSLFQLQYCTGAAIYAEPTENSSLQLSQTLAKLAGDDFCLALARREVLFSDLGAGTATFVTTLARPRNCPVLAIEYCKTRCLLALNTLKVATKMENLSYPFKVAYLPMNIFDLVSLEPPPGVRFLVVYLGDEAFDKSLMDKIASLLLQVSVQIILITDKAGRHKEYGNYWESKGNFEPIGQVPWSKRGGNNEPGNFFIYKLLPSCKEKLLIDQRVHHALRMCAIQATDTMRTEYFDATIKAIEDGSYPIPLYGASLHRKTVSACQAETLKHCPSNKCCANCKKYFRHRPSLAMQGRSSVHENGLLAAKKIAKGTFLFKFGGTHVPEGSKEPSVITTKDGAIDVSTYRKHEGKCRFLNHGCSPNVQLVDWIDSDGQSITSVVSTKDIQEGVEILIEYVRCNFDVCACPRCATLNDPSSKAAELAVAEAATATAALMAAPPEPERRTNRDIHAIRWGCDRFQKRLNTLFFMERYTSEAWIDIQAFFKQPNKPNAIAVKRQSKRRDAPIYSAENFLSEKDLRFFEKMISEIKFHHSRVDRIDYPSGKRLRLSTVIDKSQRNSKFYSFQKRESSRVAALERRIASIFCCDEDQIEPLQLVRYLPGEYFDLHHDMTSIMNDGSLEVPLRSVNAKRRIVTIFCYLNTLNLDQGGATYFPECGNLRVRPQRGRAVIWSNVTKEGAPDHRTVHAGEEVLDVGSRKVTPVVKYGLNIWITEK